MDPAILVAIIICLFSANIGLLYLLRKAYNKPPKALTVTAEALLHDLSSGPAIIRVERIDRENLLLRSPRS